jgi:predicted  nucleic acid-binding Zn-ribbon protein
MKRPLELAVNASSEELSEEYKQLQELKKRRHVLEGEIAHINRELGEETAHRKACKKRLNPLMPQESRKALTVSINVALERETSLGASLSKLRVDRDRLLRAETALSAQLAPQDANASAASQSWPAGQAAGKKIRKRGAVTYFRLRRCRSFPLCTLPPPP